MERETERETQRETERVRQTDRERPRERERETLFCVQLHRVGVADCVSLCRVAPGRVPIAS